MNLKILFSDLSNTPLNVIIPKFLDRFKTKTELDKVCRTDSDSQSFNYDIKVDWTPIFSLGEIQVYDKDIGSNKPLAEKYIKHEFDILGSGWVNWGYDRKSSGFMGHTYESDWNALEIDFEGKWLKSIVNDSNGDQSLAIWKIIQELNSSYIPIDWQKDIRSGYRYNSKEHFSTINPVNGIPGVDVKVPWELGRLQHLPVLAISALDEDSSSDQIITEVKCQILDFILSNPPRWGVQWTSAMDVSIRALNVAITLDLLIQLDPKLSSSVFYKHVCNSIKEHITFAWSFRESKNGLSNNHYLANLLGVVYGSYALQKDQEVKNILESAIKELWKELDKQFLDDGGNFESSIPYHFFASEIAALTIAITKRIKSDKSLNIFIDVDLYKRVENKIALTLDLMQSCTLANCSIPQIGDNDSARMLYLSIPYSLISNDEASEKYKNFNWLKGEDSFIDRDYLNYSSSIEMVKACFESNSETLHSAFIHSISKGQLSKLHVKDRFENMLSIADSSLKYSQESEYKVKNESLNLKANLGVEVYNDFGLYIFKGDNIHLLVNGTNRHVRQYWPHSHNDKLSFELWIGGKAVIQDPGSFVYTALPEERNKYRSIQAHATVIFEDEEQNNWIDGIQGVFRTVPKTNVELIAVDKNSLRLKSTYKKYVHERHFIIENDKLLIKDFASHPFKVNKRPDIPFSNGYGKMLN